MTKWEKKAFELHKAYFLGAYSPNDDAANVAALAKALEAAYDEGWNAGGNGDMP